MVAEDRAIGCVGSLVLLHVLMVLCMLLIGVLVLLKIIHHLHLSTAPSPSVDTAMLPLLVTEHSVETLSRRVGIWRSRWGRSVGVEYGSDVIGRGTVANYLVLPGMMSLCVLWKIVIASTLLWESVTIGHLKPPRTDRAVERAPGLERSRYGDVIAWYGLGRRIREWRAKLSSLAHRSAEDIL